MAAAQKELSKYLAENFHIKLSNPEAIGLKKKWDEGEAKAVLFKTPIDDVRASGPKTLSWALKRQLSIKRSSTMLQSTHSSWKSRK